MSTEYPIAGVVCVTGNGQTPFITADMAESRYYANGRLITSESSQNRALADGAKYLASSGILNGKKIGIVSGDGSDNVAVNSTLVPTLRSLGHAPVDVEVIPPTGVNRIPIAVSNFKAKGVDLVIFACNPGLPGPFVQAATRSGLNPTWALSSFNSETTDSTDSYLPDSFDGTIGFTQDSFPIYNSGAGYNALDRSCIDRVGKADPKVAHPSGLASRSPAVQVALRECAVFDLWVAAATHAGNGLTRHTLISSFESLGSVTMARQLGGSFGPGKHDAGDFVLQAVWRKSCHCWLPAHGNQPRRLG
jgi:hypothetical protein